MKTEVKLKYPIKIAGAEVPVLAIRRPNVRDLKAARLQSKGGTDQFEFGLALVSMLAEIPPDAVLDIDAADYGELEKVIEDFFPKRGE